MMVDHFTKFVVAAPYRKCDAEETCKLILKRWICPIGAPIALQSDNAPQFTAALTTEFARVLQILIVHSRPYHPQTNGLVERQNKTLINLLKAICSKKQDDWDETLETAVGAYNSTKHASTGFTPNLLWFGREKRIPLMILFPKDEVEFKTHKPYVNKLLTEAARIHALTRRNTQQAQIRQKRNFDKTTGHQVPFKEGDVVMMHAKIVPRGGTSKLLRAWRGPYVISQVCQGGRWYILQNGAMTHYERLKSYNPRVTEMHPSFEMEVDLANGRSHLGERLDEEIADDSDEEEEEEDPEMTLPASEEPFEVSPVKWNMMNTEFLDPEEPIMDMKQEGFDPDFYRTDQHRVFDGYQSDSTYDAEEEEEEEEDEEEQIPQ